MTSRSMLRLDAMGPGDLEAKLEAGTRPVELSSGDYIHFYAAVACNSFVKRGNYTVGASVQPLPLLQLTFTQHQAAAADKCFCGAWPAHHQVGWCLTRTTRHM